MKELNLDQMQLESSNGVGECIAALAAFAVATAAVVTMPATVAFLPFMITSMSFGLSAKTASEWC